MDMKTGIVDAAPAAESELEKISSSSEESSPETKKPKLENEEDKGLELVQEHREEEEEEEDEIIEFSDEEEWLKETLKKNGIDLAAQDEEYDSEEDDYLMGRSKEEADEIWAKYAKRVKESEGYDVDVDCFPGGFYAVYAPFPDFKEGPKFYDKVKGMANAALEFFKNESDGKIYELVDVDKVVGTSGLLFLLTFRGKELDASSDAVKVFQAEVGYAITHSIVYKCRFKPTTS